jgi:four helix bundle protein
MNYMNFSQLRRSADSVVTNIAEGYGRKLTKEILSNS